MASVGGETDERVELNYFHSMNCEKLKYRIDLVFVVVR